MDVILQVIQQFLWAYSLWAQPSMRYWFDTTMWQGMWHPTAPLLLFKRRGGHGWYHMIDFCCPFLEIVARRIVVNKHIIRAHLHLILSFFFYRHANSVRSNEWLQIMLGGASRGAQLSTSYFFNCCFRPDLLRLQYWSVINDCPPLVSTMGEM